MEDVARCLLQVSGPLSWRVGGRGGCQIGAMATKETQDEGNVAPFLLPTEDLLGSSGDRAPLAAARAAAS